MAVRPIKKYQTKTNDQNANFVEKNGRLSKIP